MFPPSLDTSSLAPEPRNVKHLSGLSVNDLHVPPQIRNRPRPHSGSPPPAILTRRIIRGIHRVRCPRIDHLVAFDVHGLASLRSGHSASHTRSCSVTW